jgi:hypothetical protein
MHIKALFTKEIRMNAGNEGKIRQAVRDSYGKVTRLGTKASGLKQALSYSGEQEILDARGLSASCCGAPEFTPEKLSKTMGYVETNKPE